MSTQSAATQSKETPSTIKVNSKNDQIHQRIRERIECRAYDLYQQEGNRHGEDMRHWLQAESEVLTDVPEIRESSSWFTANIPVRGFDPSEIEVSIEPRSALVVAEKQQTDASEPGRSSGTEQAIFSRASWPAEIDPETASAYVKNGMLTVTAKRAMADERDREENRAAQKAK